MQSTVPQATERLRPWETLMKKQDRQAMEAHGITRATRNVYFYKDYKYDRLDDAVRYAETDARRVREIDVRP